MIFYFGTFNPIHNGHIQIARDVEKTLGSVILIPAYDSPWKPELKQNFSERVAMIQCTGLKYDDIERHLPTPSYTYQTVQELHKRFGEVDFIIGYDQFFLLDKWKHYKILKDLCHFIVIPRKDLTEDYNNRLDKMRDAGYKFHVFNTDFIDIASSQIREMCKNNQDISKLVPENIKSYIEVFGLYQK